MSELRSKCCGARVKYLWNGLFYPLYRREHTHRCLKCYGPTAVREKKEPGA